MKKLILPVLALISVLIFILSFIDFSPKKQLLSFIDLKENVKEITIQNENSKITLFYEDETWKAQKNHIIFPVEKQIIENLLQKLEQKRTFEKIFTSNSKNDFYSNEKFEISILENDKNLSFTIGDSDFSLLNRYVKFQNETLKIAFNIEELLHTDERFFIDPHFIPRTLVFCPDFKISFVKINYNQKNYTILPGKTKKIGENEVNLISRLKELRHGSFFAEQNKNPVILQAEIETENQKFFYIFVKPYSETDFTVEYSVKGKKNDDYNYSVLISAWTFKNILELLD